MSPDERRAQLVDAALPLVREFGSEVTTRQIAEAAGVAEGTVFRAFPDKPALIRAVIERAMDPSDALAAIRDIDPMLDLAGTVRELVQVVRARVERVSTVMAALGPQAHQAQADAHKEHAASPERDARAHGHHAHGITATDSEAVKHLERHADQLRIDPEAAVLLVRVLSFGSALPPFAAPRALTVDEIVDLILHGISKEGH